MGVSGVAGLDEMVKGQDDSQGLRSPGSIHHHAVGYLAQVFSDGATDGWIGIKKNGSHDVLMFPCHLRTAGGVNQCPVCRGSNFD